VRHGLGELYEYYERNAESLAPIIRDIDVHPPTRELMALRFEPRFAEMHAALGEPFRATGHRRQRVLGVLRLVLDFATWRTLRQSVPSSADAVEAAVRSLIAQ
jgi:hypothetical protein